MLSTSLKCGGDLRNSLYRDRSLFSRSHDRAETPRQQTSWQTTELPPHVGWAGPAAQAKNIRTRFAIAHWHDATQECGRETKESLMCVQARKAHAGVRKVVCAR